MIGIDTDVLLRLLLNDDAGQMASIEKLFDAYAQRPGSVLISDVVLAETVWTLGAVYRQPKAALLNALRAMLAEPAYAFESRAAVEHAVESCAGGRAGFSDALIVAKNAAAGCEFTASFNRALRGVAGANVL
ncbi:MAG: type II toxin-antitoxin system VapC family toxin [Caldimonas sp.]|nr:type II toxin-antitoxin system VapC family toxin [Pseudomonadota bacterium]